MKKIRFMAALLCLVLVNVIPVSATEEVSLPMRIFYLMQKRQS